MTTEDLTAFTTIYTDLIEESTTIFEDTTTTVILRPNCSIYNPCGLNGHCRNSNEDEWTCICKFWWIGTTCDEMTSNGKQIIALGVILFVLLAIFYGLDVFYKRRHRQKQSKKNDEKPVAPTRYRKFSTTSIYEPPVTRRIFEVITFIATVLLATGTLIAKWRILQPIHDDIVEKFLNESSIYFTRHSLCHVIDFRNDFNVITFPVACLLILVFSAALKRVSFHRGKGCRGHFGLPIPLNFFGHWKRTFTAVVFAIFADELMDIANQIFSGTQSSESSGIILRYLRQIYRVLVIGVRRYPTLAAIYIDTPFSLICGLLYTWLDFIITILLGGFCRNDFYPTDQNYDELTGNFRISRYLRYYGTGPKLIVIQLLMDVPLYLFLSYISVKLLMLTIKRLRHRHRGGRVLNRDQKELLYSSLPHSIESRYVRNLLGMNPSPDKPRNRLLKVFPFIYEWRSDYRFSTRIVSVYAAIFLLLYFLSVQAIVRFPTQLIPAQDDLQEFADFIAPLVVTQYPNLKPDEGKGKDFRLPDFGVPYYLAISLTIFITILQLFTMLASIRRNMLQAYRGDYSEIPVPTIARHVRYVSGNFRFAGTLIGYVILGFVMLGGITFILMLLIVSLFAFGGSRFIEAILKFLIPFLLFIFFKMYLNKILSRYVFLQHRLNVLSINNRRSFMIFLYFNIFLDAFLGLVTAVMRLVRSIIGGIIYMCRLDYSPLGRKLELKDAGFSAYCAFIYVECAHRHPVLLCFMSHLLRSQLYGRSKKRLSKARHKWAIAVFLINNPKLAFYRKSHLRRQEEREWHQQLIPNEKNNPPALYPSAEANYSFNPRRMTYQERL